MTAFARLNWISHFITYKFDEKRILFIYVIYSPIFYLKLCLHLLRYILFIYIFFFFFFKIRYSICRRNVLFGKYRHSCYALFRRHMFRSIIRHPDYSYVISNNDKSTTRNEIDTILRYSKRQKRERRSRSAWWSNRKKKKKKKNEGQTSRFLVIDHLPGTRSL